jgi:Tfp pilus assembly protein PilW
MVEALVAFTISSALVVMVGAVFLVQNEFFAWILLRSQVQENARSITELVGSEMRSVVANGGILADSSRLWKVYYGNALRLIPNMPSGAFRQ